MSYSVAFTYAMAMNLFAMLAKKLKVITHQFSFNFGRLAHHNDCSTPAKAILALITAMPRLAFARHTNTSA